MGMALPGPQRHRILKLLLTAATPETAKGLTTIENCKSFEFPIDSHPTWYMLIMVGMLFSVAGLVCGATCMACLLFRYRKQSKPSQPTPPRTQQILVTQSGLSKTHVFHTEADCPMNPNISNLISLRKCKQCRTLLARVDGMD